MELEIYNISGQKTNKKLKLDDTVFGIEPNDHAIYLDVKQHLANKRQGTHKAKERNEVKGSTRKVKRQKGTGTARFGDIKNPIFRGGGRIFGPKPRDYHFKLNKKLKKLARLSALSYKAKENNIIVVEDFSFESPKTKSFIEMLGNFELQDKKVLLILHQVDKNVFLSSRNLQKAKVVSADAINTYDILNAQNVLLLESSAKEIEKIHSVN
ncbi:MAG: 50S ribosomal protein L4 [Bacteroidales bacterium]|nr:50S ribosomal protein L4 [Bacteroidales bacterium]MCF8403851.1 50S ribosomal protein L4 [Bacteroidales bacterium]